MFCKPRLRASAKGCGGDADTNTPTSGNFPCCCASPASGQRDGGMAAAPPSSDMNARRLMGAPPQVRAAHYHTVAQERRCTSQQKLRADVADGSHSVIRRCRLNVRFARTRTWVGDL